jgi:hypothetical protein
VKKYSFICFAIVFLLNIAGCGLKYVELEHPEKFNSACLKDPNHSPFEITRSDTDPNKNVIRMEPCRITLDKPCRVDYRKLEWWLRSVVVVDCRLPNGKEYPVCIDSGCTHIEVLVNDLVVEENNLETLFGETGEEKISLIEKRKECGLCFLPSLKIAEMIIENPFCVWKPRHWEFQIFGLPLWQDKYLFLGNYALCRFHYIRFDNAKMQVEFSYTESFQPEQSEKWARYPFTVRKSDYRIMVDIPIAGEIYNIYFDTCGAIELQLRPELWGKIRSRITAAIPKNSKCLTYQFGYLPCRSTIVERLSIGNIELKNADVVIWSEDAPYLSKDLLGCISLLTFRNTSVVLDFERNLLWVKNQQR